MNENDYFDLLNKIGWFDEWPVAARDSAKATIRKNRKHGGSLEFPGYAMMSFWCDGESVESDNAYTKILGDLRSASHGFFKPKKIRETWTQRDDGDHDIEISFEFHSRLYVRQLEFSGDWIDEGVFDMVNEALAGLEPKLRFIPPGGSSDQCYIFMLIPVGVIAAAIEGGILPPFDD